MGRGITASRAAAGLRLPAALLLAALAVLRAGAAAAEDSDQLRWYGAIRYEMVPLTRAHDFVGGQIGLNVNRYFGAELALDSYERKVGELSEMSVVGVTPQLRLRYPLFDDRLVPYLIGGLGVAITQANDRRLPVTWTDGKNGAQVSGTVGAGIEYFIADNIALGWEAKQFISGGIDYEANGKQGRAGLTTGLVGLSVRVFYPMLHPEAAAEQAAEATARMYLDLRTGGALLSTALFDGVDGAPEQRVFGSNFSYAFGVSLGANFGRYWAVEMSVDNYEMTLSIPGTGNIGEYAVFPVLVQPRFRYPLLDGRLQPYALLGLGAELGQANDLNETGKALDPDTQDISLIGAIGAGLEYYLIENVAIGLQTKYIISRGHELQFTGQEPLSGNLDAFLLMGNIRIVFWDI